MFWIRFLKLLPALLATGKLALVKVSYMSAALYSLSELSEHVDVSVFRPPITFARFACCLTGVKTMFCTGCVVSHVAFSTRQNPLSQLSSIREKGDNKDQLCDGANSARQNRTNVGYGLSTSSTLTKDAEVDVSEGKS